MLSKMPVYVEVRMAFQNEACMPLNAGAVLSCNMLPNTLFVPPHFALLIFIFSRLSTRLAWLSCGVMSGVWSGVG